MSQATSPSPGQPYGLARVCRVWGVARSTLYWQRHACSAPGARAHSSSYHIRDHTAALLISPARGAPQ
jgi:hypothetical protein